MIAALLLAGVLVLAGCSPAAQTPETAHYPAEVATAWFDLTLDLIRTTPGYTPPVASRALGYMGVTLYETVRPGMPGYATLAGQLNQLDTLPQPSSLARYHWPAAANHALAAQARAFFPAATDAMQAEIDRLEASYTQRYAHEVDAATLQRSQAWGGRMAAAIYAWSTSDGGHEGYLTNFAAGYVSPVGVGLWVPTPPAHAQSLQPYWGQNRPFVLTAGDTCPAPEPPDYSEEVGSAFYAEAYEVYQTVSRRDPAEVATALFWADDPGRTATPPGHWVSILGQVLTQEQATLDVAAEGYAKVGLAVADAFITCWHTKYVYHLLRPISYIQTVIDPAWNVGSITDPVSTPPFPEYTSGHSVQSGAAAMVLSALFGADYVFTDHTHDGLELEPRSYASFEAAAQEAAISRLYGGIHYRSAIEQGLEQGRCVAGHVLDLTFRR
jgi:hypothetical protein